MEKKFFMFLNKKKGFSITEVLFALIISTAVIATIVSVWTFTNKVWIQKSEQTLLRIELMQALEVIKKDIRLSSFTDMVFYPDNKSSYTAVSLPVADTDANGLFSFNAQGKIEWDKTVIYHIYTDVSGEKTLRRTVYDPRDNTLTEDQRYAQLQSVVTNGVGSTGSSTDKEFMKELDTFEISPLSSVFDFYDESTTPVKVGKVVFGWAKLEPGDHTIKFEIAGKNDDSTGYDIGIDSLMIEPCGSTREVEYYNSSYAPLGAISVSGGSVSLVNDDIWSNDNFLEYRATGPGDYVAFTDYYDLWRESSFEEASLNNSELTGAEVRASLSVPDETDEGEYAWFAYIASGDVNQAGSDGKFNSKESKPDITEVVIRTLIRSTATSMSEQEIDPERSLVRIRLKAAQGYPVTINRAYITRKDVSGAYDGLENKWPTSPYDPSDYHMHQQLFFRDPSSGKVTEGITIEADNEVFSLWSAYPFHTDEDYLLTLYIGDATSLESKYWENPGAVTQTYYISLEEVINCNVTGNVFNAAGHNLDNGDQAVVDLDSSFLSKMSGTPDWSGSLPSVYTVEKLDSDSFKLEQGGVYLTLPSGAHTVHLWSGVENSICIYFSANIDAWDNYGSVESQVTDTTQSSPLYNEISYSENRPSGTDILLKARSSGNSDMSGATEWSAISGSSSNPYALAIGAGRYVQFQGEYTSEPYWEEEISAQQLTYSRYIQLQRINTNNGMPYRFPGYPAFSDNFYTTQLREPWIDDVTIDWPGTSSICTLTGYVSKMDSYGQAIVTIDGEALLKVLSLHLKVSKPIHDKIVEVENYIEIEPRNTGK